MNARYRNLDNDPRGDWKPTDATAQAGHGTASQFYELLAPNGQTFQQPTGRCWVYTKERMQEMIADNRVWFGNDGKSAPAIKRFLTEVKQGVACQTIWKYEDVGHNQEGKKEIKILFPEAIPFDTPKPTRLINRILQIATNPTDSDIILDFFSGSATTAHAVMQLNKEDGGNRRFILVQLPEICGENSEAFKAGYTNICEIGKERIRRAGQKTQNSMHKLDSAKMDQFRLDGGPKGCTSPSLDTGFKVFKLDTSNLKTWDSSPIADDDLLSYANRFNDMIDRVKSDRTDLDMVYEIMLKMGVPLTEPVTKVSISDGSPAGGKTAYSVGEDCLLLICLTTGLTVEIVEKMTEYAPAKIIVAENSLADDSAMSNAHYILRDRGIELKLV